MLYCRQLDYLAIRVELDVDRLRALDPGRRPGADSPGAAGVGPGLRAGAARPDATARGQHFRWLTAPRSTVIQPGPVHTGLTADPVAEHERLMRLLVRPVGEVKGGSDGVR